MAHLLQGLEARQQGLGSFGITLEHGERYEQRRDDEGASGGEVVGAVGHHLPEQSEGLCMMTNCSPAVGVEAGIVAG